MASPNQAFCRSNSGTSGVSHKIHYLVIGSIIPTLAFNIPLAVIEHNAGAIMGLIVAGISSIVSIYRSGALTRKRPNGQSYEYQVLLPQQESFEQGLSNVRARVGSVGKTEKTFFALVDFIFGALLTVAVVLLYTQHGGGRWWHEPPELIVVKTWGSWPLILDALIHLYLFFHVIIHALMTRSDRALPVCSRCRGPLGEDSPPPTEPNTARPSMESVGPEMRSMV